MKILKKLLAFTTTLALSVSAMAFSLTASAETYNGKVYDTVYSDNDLTYNNTYEFNGDICIASNIAVDAYSIILNDKCTLDIYGELAIFALSSTFGETVINIYPGGKLQFKYDVENKNGSTLTINNYGGTLEKEYPLQTGTTVNEYNKITPDTENDKNTNTINATTSLIPAPTYTVTIPEEINFGTQDRALKNDSDEDRLATAEGVVKYEATNLDVNEKILTVTVSQINPLTAKVNGTDYSINYTLSTNDTSVTAGTKLVEIGGKECSNVIAETEVPITATLDKSDIEVEADYTGSVIFTVALTDE